MEAQLRFMADQGVDLIITSGGLGPTADDMTVEVVARFAGRPLVLDEALEERIADILRGLMQRFRHWDFDAVRAANRKQALVPEGAYVIYPVGTAPGVVVPGKPTVVVPPGPAARASGDVGRGGVHAAPSRRPRRAAPPTSRTRCACSACRSRGWPRRCGWPSRRSQGFDRLEITTCLRRAEVEVVTRHEPGDGPEAYAALVELIRGAPPARAVLRPTARRWTTRWPSCSPGAGSPPPSPARPA